MKIIDALLGRTKAAPANLDALFALPSAAISLEAAAGLRTAGQAAVAFKPASGTGFTTATEELAPLLDLSANQSASKLSFVDDSFGYRWVVVQDDQLEDLVATVHLVNATLADRGFSSQLLCSVFAFHDEHDEHDASCLLVYLFKRGTFYPFAPRANERRDNELELQVRAAVTEELPMEADLSRWFALWGVPVG